MDGPRVFEFTLQGIPILLSELDKIHDILMITTYFIRPIVSLSSTYIRNAKSQRVLSSNIEKYGNCSASIPLLLASEPGALI